MTGKQASDYIGRNSQEVYGGCFGQLGYQKHRCAMASGQSQVYEIHLPLNGKMVHIRTHLTPLKSREDGKTLFIGTSEDITPEHELAESRSRAVSVMQEIEHFIHLAAHDLRTPMLKINALTDTIRDGFEDLGDGKLEALDLLESVACSSLSLVEEILERVNTTGVPEVIEHFDLNSVCEESMNLLDPERLNDIQVEDARLHGDRIATQMIVRNLLDNALKHNADQKVSVRISAAALQNGFFKLTVTDNGRGTSEPHRLFTVDRNRTLKSGFGLLGVSQLIRSRGGVIYATSPTDATGLSVHFTLPGELTFNSGDNHDRSAKLP